MTYEETVAAARMLRDQVGAEQARAMLLKKGYTTAWLNKHVPLPGGALRNFDFGLVEYQR